jgi:hypothetical protein
LRCVPRKEEESQNSQAISLCYLFFFSCGEQMADSLMTGKASEEQSKLNGRGSGASGPPPTLQLTGSPPVPSMMDIHDDDGAATSASTSNESQKRKMSDAGVALSLLDESPTKTRPPINLPESSSQASTAAAAASNNSNKTWDAGVLSEPIQSMDLNDKQNQQGNSKLGLIDEKSTRFTR